MDAIDVIIELTSRIRSMETDLSLAKYREEDLKKENAKLLEENEALQKKIDELEF